MRNSASGHLGDGDSPVLRNGAGDGYAGPAGKCRIAVTGYTGKGKYGIENSNQLTFQYPPLAVFIFGEDVGLMSRGKRLYVVRSGSTASAEATWAADGKSVRWHSGHATAQMNVENVFYTVVYLYQA